MVETMAYTICETVDKQDGTRAGAWKWTPATRSTEISDLFLDLMTNLVGHRPVGQARKSIRQGVEGLMSASGIIHQNQIIVRKIEDTIGHCATQVTSGKLLDSKG